MCVCVCVCERERDSERERVNVCYRQTDRLRERQLDFYLSLTILMQCRFQASAN